MVKCVYRLPNRYAECDMIVRILKDVDSDDVEVTVGRYFIHFYIKNLDMYIKMRIRSRNEMLHILEKIKQLIESSTKNINQNQDVSDRPPRSGTLRYRLGDDP